jgi:hypothetical protein
MKRPLLALSGFLALLTALAGSQPRAIEVGSLAELARAAAQDHQRLRLAPGVYRMADYLTPEVLERIHAEVDRTQARPPVPMLTFRGSHNHFDLRGVVIEIDNALYRLLPGGGYTRCLIIAGHDNHFDGLTIRHMGPNDGSGGNTVSVAGARNVLENVTLHVHGSFPYGYGDLLGKGGPNLLPLRKQSGIQILGAGTTLRRCKVFSRAFGHCFYIQAGDDIVLEDCYAEGVMRTTNDMLRDLSGPAQELDFRSVYENRDGRYRITPGYTKSLVEDGFRTYGSAGNVALINCVAIRTRAGFEIGARDDASRKTIIENGLALECERAYLLGSNVVVRRSRGDVTNGPLLYLRGGRDSDIELELTGAGGGTTVHALATLAGEGHRVRLSGPTHDQAAPSLPIMLGFGMPDHAEMASPIRPASARRVALINELARMPVMISAEAADCEVETAGVLVADENARQLGPARGAWPAAGIAR